MELELKKLTEGDNKEQNEVPPPGSTDSSSVEEEEEEERLKKTSADGDGGDSPVLDGDSRTDLEECRSESQTIDFQPSNSLLFDLD